MSDIVSELQEIRESVEKVELAVKENSASSVVHSLLWIAIAIGLISVGQTAWHSKWRYAIQYGVSSGKVQITDQPHDCEFLTAPLGAKHCKFEVNVSTLRWAKSTEGQPIASSDGGKTWDVFTPDPNAEVPQFSTVERVYVSWEKKTM